MTEIRTLPAALAAMPRVSPGWLALREPADAAARSDDLVAAVSRRLAGRPRLVIHDLGCGTGAVARWLAPRLPYPQHWVMYDRDAALLDCIPAAAPADSVTLQTRRRDVTELTVDELGGADLITASALLDLLTAEEVDRIVTACADAGCPTLVTICVVGRVSLDPPELLDVPIGAAFDAHQRRVVSGRRLLGPDAVGAIRTAFGRHRVATLVRPSPWRLGADDAELLTEWFGGWLGAACEQAPTLVEVAAAYSRRRLRQIAAGRLTATVHHVDLLALPAPAGQVG
jgi:Methyltransferase domain